MTTPTNADLWNGPNGERWVRHQDALDQALAPLSDAALAQAAPMGSERVLDVGCGCGTTTMALARGVGPGGIVVGVDISRPMLARARERMGSEPYAHVELRHEDAAAAAFQPRFDLVFSRFGVMFFDDPRAAFANLRAALAPGGRMVFVCWRAREENPWMTVPHAAALTVVPPPPPPPPDAPGPFALADAARVRRLLEAAGFAGIALDRLDRPMRLGATLDLATDYALGVGPTAALHDEADAATKGRLRAAVRVALAPFAAPDGLALPAACWIVRATG